MQIRTYSYSVAISDNDDNRGIDKAERVFKESLREIQKVNDDLNDGWEIEHVNSLPLGNAINVVFILKK